MTGHTQVLEIVGFETIEDKVAMGVLKVTDEDKDLPSDAELEESSRAASSERARLLVNFPDSGCTDPCPFTPPSV